MSPRYPLCRTHLTPNRFGMSQCRNLTCAHNAQVARESEGRYGRKIEFLVDMFMAPMRIVIELAYIRNRIGDD